MHTQVLKTQLGEVRTVFEHSKRTDAVQNAD